MTRRQLLRLISYSLLGILFLFLLILYSLYLSAQRPPKFYRDALAVSDEIEELRNKEMLRKVRNLNNDVQKTDRPWQGDFSVDELNAYLATEVAKPGSNLFPKEISEPRLSISGRKIEFACRVERNEFAGILHLTCSLTLPEPNRMTLRIREARLGRIPISRKLSEQILFEMLEKNGYRPVRGNEAGDPTLSVELGLKYGKGKAIRLETLDIENGSVQLSGQTLRTDSRPASEVDGPSSTEKSE